MALVAAVFINPFQLEQEVLIKGISLGEAITIITVAIGMIIGIKEAENALRPYVDVGVIFDNGSKKTRFQFLQRSKIPALVWLDIKPKINGRLIDSDERKWWLDDDSRLWGERPWIVRLDNRATSIYALKRIADAVTNTESGEAELFIKVSVAPIFRKHSPSLYEEKHYVFSKSDNNPRWIDEAWGMEDVLYPGFYFLPEKNNFRNE